MTTPDTILLARWAVSRDPEAFDEIVSRYAGLVYRTCRRILHNEADAEDVTQECFLDLAHGKERRIGSLGAWLHTVATHRCLNLVKKDTRRRSRERVYNARESDQTQENRDEVRLHVDRAIESLPPKLRCVIVAHFLERRSHETIARELGVTRQAVGYRARKGVELIRTRLRKSGVIAGSATLSGLFDSEAAEAAPASLGAALGRIAISGSATTSRTIGTGRATNLAAKLVPLAVAVTLIMGSVVYVAIDLGTTGDTPPRGTSPPIVVSDDAPRNPTPIETNKEKNVQAEPRRVVPKNETDPPRVAGRVVDEDGRTIPGARVILYRTRNWGLGDKIVAETESLEEGEFSLDIEWPIEPRPSRTGKPDQYFLFATHPDFALSWFVLPPDALLGAYELTMTEPKTRTITVVDRDGEPLPDVRLWLYAAGNRESSIPHLREYFRIFFDVDLTGAMTDAQGVARIGNLPDANCSFQASLEGYADGIACGSCTTVTMVLGATVAGRVITDDGMPLAGAEISARPNGMWQFFKTLTDGEGRFRLEKLPPRGWAMCCGSTSGGMFEISLVHDEYCAPNKMNLLLEPGQRIDNLTFEAMAGTPVHCLVVDSDTGEPVPGARLEGFNARGRIQGFTDSEGTFETVVAAGKTSLFFHSPPPGLYVTETSLNFPGSTVRFVAEGAEIAVTIRSPPIVGRLVNIRGEITNFDPMTHSKTVVHAAAGSFKTARGGSVRDAVVDKNGRFELEEVPSGRRLHLFALTRNREWAATGVFETSSTSDGYTAPIEAAEPDPVTLTLRPTRRVTKRLEREDGSVPADASVSLYPVVEGEVIYRAKRDVRTDGDGSVDLNGILSGLEYMVWVEASRAGRRRASGSERKDRFKLVLAPE